MDKAGRVPTDMQQNFILRMRARSRLWEQFIGPSLKAMGNCFPQLPRHLGEEARLPPFTIE